MNDNMERKERLSKLILDVLLEYPLIARKPLSQNEIAVMLGVDTSSFSQWATQKRLPTGDNIYSFARGIEALPKGRKGWIKKYYETMGIPMPVPADLIELADFWYDDNITDEQRRAIRERIKNELSKIRGSEGAAEGAG